jgi:hypothetical protein
MHSRAKPSAASWSVGLVLSLAALAPAQDKPAGTPADAESVGTQARRLVRFIELPERCTEAWRGLLQLREAAAPPLALALQDPRPEVAIRAAWILGQLGRDAEMAMPALQRGAKGKEAQVALACRWALDRITFRGTLLADYGDNSVVHLDEKGEVVRTIGDASGAWFAEPTTGGNLLISEFAANRVREVNSKGEDVWSFTDLSQPYQVQRLPGGTTLISDAGNGRIVEVDGDGKVVWELKGLRRPVAAERLPDGHTLITEQEAGRVHEIDAEGRVVLEVKGLGSPQRAQRLPNGNTLIAVHRPGEVIEVDASGKTVGESRKHPQAQMALRRSDGHTLIACTKYWAELDAEGKEVWRRDGKYAVGILRQ